MLYGHPPKRNYADVRITPSWAVTYQLTIIHGKVTKMKNQSRFGSTNSFFSALAMLFCGLLGYSSALSYNGRENNFLAENWGAPVAILLALMFGLGWWVEYIIEYLVLFKGRKTAILVYVAFISAYLFVGLGPLVLPVHDFLKHAISAGAFISLGGFILRSSITQPGIIAKLGNHGQ